MPIIKKKIKIYFLESSENYFDLVTSKIGARKKVCFKIKNTIILGGQTLLTGDPPPGPGYFWIETP